MQGGPWGWAEQREPGSGSLGPSVPLNIPPDKELLGQPRPEQGLEGLG